MAETVKATIKVVDEASKSLKKIETRTKGLQIVSVDAFVNIARTAARATKAVLNFATGGIKLADRMDDLSKRTGIATDTLSVLGFAAERGGASLESVETGLRTLALRASDAANGLENSAREFRELGIDVKEADGSLKSVDDLLLEIADSFQKMDDQTRKAAAAQKIFGGRGIELLPILDEGREGLEAYRKEAERLGVVIDKETAQAASDLDDQMVNLTNAVQGIQIAFVTVLGPALDGILTSVTDAIVEFREWATETDSAKTSFSVLGTAIKAVIGEITLVGKVAAGTLQVFKVWTEEGLIAAARESDKLIETIKQGVINIVGLGKATDKQTESQNRFSQSLTDTSSALVAATQEAKRLAEERTKIAETELEKLTVARATAFKEDLELLDAKHGLEVEKVREHFAAGLGPLTEEGQGAITAITERHGIERSELEAQLREKQIEDEKKFSEDRAKIAADTAAKLVDIGEQLTNILLTEEGQRENAFKAMLQKEARTRLKALIENGINELLIREGIEVGKLATAAPFSLGASLALIPVVIAASLAAQGAVKAIGLKHGGEVTGGTPGTDSVPALLTPGEIVLPEPVANFLTGESAGGRGRSMMASSGQVTVNVGRLELFGDRRYIQLVAEKLNELTQRGGGRLLASRVIS